MYILFHIDIMLQMGYTQEEIQDSLVNQKYDEIMAAYLLLDYRNSEVHQCMNTLQLLAHTNAVYSYFRDKL